MIRPDATGSISSINNMRPTLFLFLQGETRYRLERSRFEENRLIGLAVRKSCRITCPENTLARGCKRLYAEVEIAYEEPLRKIPLTMLNLETGIQHFESRGLATSVFLYFIPKSPPKNPPPLPPLCPLMASSSIHSRRKSLSFISSTLVSLVCSCASCLLKANKVGILVIYILINFCLPSYNVGDVFRRSRTMYLFVDQYM